jgi:hypothetical protein
MQINSCLLNDIFVRSRLYYRPMRANACVSNYAIQSDFRFCPKTFANQHIRSFSCYGAGYLIKQIRYVDFSVGLHHFDAKVALSIDAIFWLLRHAI